MTSTLQDRPAAPRPDPRRTLTLHVGTHKTGSTSLQQAAFANRERLLAAGTAVLETATRGFSRPHHNLAYEALDMRRFKPGRGTLAEAEAEARPLDAPNVLVTSESFSGRAVYAPKYERLRDLADRLDRRLRVVVVLREQLSYINSLYAFGVGRFAETERFEAFVRRKVRHERFRYPLVLEEWSKVADELVVLSYGPDVLDRFFAMLGAEVERPRRLNASLGAKSVEAVRSLGKNLARLDGKLEGVGRDRKSELWLARARVAKETTNAFGWNSTPFWGFDPALAQEVAQAFAQDNRELAERFGVSFEPPLDRPSTRFDPEEAGDAERLDFMEKRKALWWALKATSPQGSAG